MRALSWLNGAGALCALGVSALLLPAPPPGEDPTLLASAASTEVELSEAGERGLRDAQGVFVPLGRYERIVSGSTVADSLLFAMSEPDRVLAFTEYGLTRSIKRHLYGHKPGVVRLGRIEDLISLEPDLVLVNSLRRPDRVRRMREAGLRVFDLGEMRGLSTLLPNIRTVAQLLGAPERGEVLATRFERRMRSVAALLEPEDRVSGIYLSVFGSTLLGGTDGSSLHDVLTAAGVIDSAAERYEGWPRYTPEQLLELDPEMIVTQTGMRTSLCTFPGLAQLRACVCRGRILEIDSGTISDPSLTMLDTAELIYDATQAPELKRALQTCRDP